ncbi:hypothetical protein DRP05_03830 [Archaeoglobales archaeon]|nr:MAG: hypothetical protein DRP05_03830 [Archaeoglobales archaeon]
MNLFGFNVEVVFLVSNGDVLAYVWHYTRERAFNHMQKIVEYHGIGGEWKKSLKLERWLLEELHRVVVEGKKFSLPEFDYTNKRVYEEILKIPKGKTLTYSEIARKSGVKYTEVLMALLKNPFQVLIPCHRLLTKKGTLMGFHPLGKDVKSKILRIEGVEVE